MGIAVLVGGAWLSASQSFVTLRDGQLVHPDPWGLLLWACLIGGVFAFWVWLSTYWEWLLPRRMRVVDHSTMYTLAMENIATSVGFDMKDPSKVGITMGVLFVNGGPSIIEYEVDHMRVEIGGLTITNPIFQTKGQRLLPGHKKTYSFPTIPGVPIAPEVRGTMAYSVNYGPPSGSPRYLRTHKVSFVLSGIDPAHQALGTSHYLDLEAESDQVIRS